MKRMFFVFAMAAMIGCGFAGPMADDGQTFAAARELADDGRVEEAFRAFAAMPGGEYAAAAVARGEAAKFLRLIQADAVLMDSPRVRLIEAELLLAGGRRDEARERFKALAGVAGKGDWGTGQDGYYPVEPPGSPGDLVFYKPARPFSYGPGSHRDNWLLRRLIAFDLLDEAAREFARIWEFHRANARPHAVVSLHQDETLPPESAVRQLVHPHGYNSLGLQFALDYAYFLKRTNRPGEARDVLLEPLRVLDMDRNPNLTFPQPFGAGDPDGLPVRRVPVSIVAGFDTGLVGVPRKEFIRLVHGEFKHAGRAGAIADELQQQIDQGENRARRVLAQLKLHEGETEAALALELAYIDHGEFNAVSATYRRGLIFEAYGKTAEAVSAFERSLSADPAPLNAPDADERISGMPQQALVFSGIRHSGGMALAPGDVQERLQRLYAAQGRMEKVLEMQFAQFDGNEGTLENLQSIEELAARLKTAGQAVRFTEWAKGKLATVKSPRARANLAMLLGDYPAAVHHAAEVYQGHFYERHFWRENFAKADPKHELEYLRSVVKASPTDAMARLELLDIEDNVDGLEAIAALEALLATAADEAFSQIKGNRSRSSFNGWFDLAYRLMRLYEAHRKFDSLRALGLRMANEEKPFDGFDSHGYEPIGSNGREEFGNACLALAIQYADDPVYQAELAAALETSRWAGARSQVARRTGAKPATGTAGASPPWANLPPDTRVVVSCESVACVARNERFVYAGLPWGVAVYDSKGVPTTRILLGSPVTHLVAAGDQLWAGTEAGLFLITAETWQVTHEPVGRIVALGLDGEQLWIGVSGRSDNGLMVLNRHTLAMRTFSAEEIGIERTLDFTRFESDGDYVWADNYFGLLRYERATGTWSAVENPGPRFPVHLIGIIDGQVWADVWLNDELRHRPARLDRRTLEVTPLELRGNATRDQRMINSDIVFHGHHRGQPAFEAEGGYGGRFVVEENSNTIRRLRESGDDGPEAITDPRPSERLRIPTHAWPDGLRAGVRSTRWSERWPSDAVWAVLFDDTRRQEWLCVGAGLAVMPRDGSALRHFGSTEGLTLGPVLDGVELGGKLYFGSAWDDHRGSLTVHDPETGVFTPWFRADGMDSDKVVGLAVNDGKLLVRYGVDHPGDDTDNPLAPGRFDPATGKFTSGGSERIAPVEGKRPAPAINGILPVLGGPAYRSYDRAGMTWHCGGRGLVIHPGTKAPSLTFTPMQVRRVPSLAGISREEAKKIEIPDPVPAALLRELVKHSNPNVRFRAVKAAHRPLRGGQAAEYAPILLDCVNDPFPRVRGQAVWLLSQCNSPAALPPLREALDDTDAGIRAMATVAMARLGEVPPLEHFESVIKHSDRYSSFPYDDDSSFSVGASDHQVFTSLARHADRKIFGFLVTLPPPNLHYIEPVYPAFGESLRKHPDAASVLLAVKDENRHGPWRNFVQSTFQHAGREMLPILHEALASDERVVRSNAARACGAIGDSASIPHLLQSLDMESGLVRASIVWALGELKAVVAIPRLIQLHQSERNAEKSRSAGSGFLAMQSMTASHGEYKALSNLDSIESDWNELMTSTMRPRSDPGRDEDLLTPEHILDAVRKIGAAEAQAFYQALAAADNAADRLEATLGLAQAGPAGPAENPAILRNLLADPLREVRSSACVSLHLLGEPGLERAFREGGPAEREELLRQMKRLPRPLLEPLRKAIEAHVHNTEESEHSRALARELLEKLGESQ